MNTTRRAGLPIAEIERLTELQRQSRALRERAAKEAREELARREEAEEPGEPVAFTAMFSPLARWFLVMCGVAALGTATMAVLGSHTPDAVIILTVAAGITGLALGAIGYVMGGVK